MTLSIRDPEADRLARELAKRTGRPITTVVRDALAEYAAKAPVSTQEVRMRELMALLAEFDAIPRSPDPRSSRELINDLYDENGLPK